MVTPISALSTVQMPPRPLHSSGLTQEQNKKLENTLSNYDPQNLSDDDAKALAVQIKELGITSGRDLHDALAKSGIDARALAGQAGLKQAEAPPQRGNGPAGRDAKTQGPPPPPSHVDETALTILKDAMESYEASDTQESFADILATKLSENGYDSSKPIVDYYA